MGSIYLSTVATSPGTLFGGTWQRIQGRFLLCAGSSYAAGSTGGEAAHTLTVNAMPSHTHNVQGNKASSSYSRYPVYQAQSTGLTSATSSAGGGQPHNNMPPYLAVYAWKRTA